MKYYFAVTREMKFNDAVEKTIDELKKEGFGILTDIDVRETLKKKLGTDFRKYRILGACNPPFAYRSLNVEDKIGLMLPCNLIVQEIEDGLVEIAAIDPTAAMQGIDNPELAEIAVAVSEKLRAVVGRL